MDGIALRDAVEDDLPAIVAIYNQTVPGRLVTADTEAVTVAERRPWFAAHGRDRHPLWVAETGGAVAAWLSFSAFYGRPAYAGTSEISLYVDATWRRRGLGSHLLDQAITAAPGLGLHTLLGFIFAHNAPSLALFARHGFATWGHLPGVAELDGVPRDLCILGRRVA